MGSPPHTWRIPDVVDFLNRFLGITSTHVENTLTDEIKSNVNGDHLHTRGEYPALMLDKSELIGSPPHTWRIH